MRLARSSPWWPRLLVLLLGAVLIWQSARLFWLLLAGPALPPVVIDPLPERSAAPAEGAVVLSKWHLFGDGGAQQGLVQAIQQQAPATSLQLFLRGTLNEDAPAGGIAIIADGSGQEHAYRVGDSLPGDARLEAVYRGRVLLSRAGVTESLSLPNQEIGSGVSSAPSGSAAAPGISPFVSPQMNFDAPNLETARQALLPDVAELAKQVNVLPVLENGRFVGVRLSVGRDSKLLERSGLRSTDIVTSVNGIPLDGPQRQAELMTTLRDARQFTVTIRRDGETQTLTVGL